MGTKSLFLLLLEIMNIKKMEHICNSIKENFASMLIPQTLRNSSHNLREKRWLQFFEKYFLCPSFSSSSKWHSLAFQKKTLIFMLHGPLTTKSFLKVVSFYKYTLFPFSILLICKICHVFLWMTSVIFIVHS